MVFTTPKEKIKNSKDTQRGQLSKADGFLYNDFIVQSDDKLKIIYNNKKSKYDGVDFTGLVNLLTVTESIINGDFLKGEMFLANTDPIVDFLDFSSSSEVYFSFKVGNYELPTKLSILNIENREVSTEETQTKGSGIFLSLISRKFFLNSNNFFGIFSGNTVEIIDKILKENLYKDTSKDFLDSSLKDGLSSLIGFNNLNLGFDNPISFINKVIKLSLSSNRLPFYYYESFLSGDVLTDYKVLKSLNSWNTYYNILDEDTRISAIKNYNVPLLITELESSNDSFLHSKKCINTNIKSYNPITRSIEKNNIKISDVFNDIIKDKDGNTPRGEYNYIGELKKLSENSVTSTKHSLLNLNNDYEDIIEYDKHFNYYKSSSFYGNYFIMRNNYKIVANEIIKEGLLPAAGMPIELIFKSVGGDDYETYVINDENRSGKYIMHKLTHIFLPNTNEYKISMYVGDMSL